MIYDRSKYHLAGLPRKAKRSAAFVHIAMFFAWIADRGLQADSMEQDEVLGEPLQQLRERKILPTDFLSIAGETLMDEMMNDEGNRFCRYYYETYVWATYRVFGVAKIHQIEDTWASYDTLKAFLDGQYDEWVALGQPEDPHYKDGPIMRFLRRFF